MGERAEPQGGIADESLFGAGGRPGADESRREDADLPLPDALPEFLRSIGPPRDEGRDEVRKGIDAEAEARVSLTEVEDLLDHQRVALLVPAAVMGPGIVGVAVGDDEELAPRSELAEIIDRAFGLRGSHCGTSSPRQWNQ